MEKNMYPTVPQVPGAPNAPPTYNQTFSGGPSAPSAEYGQMMPLTPQMHQQQQLPQAIYVQNPPLGPQPCLITCPSCHQQNMSTILYETATKTHLFAALLCILGLFCCACIPYCVDTCKNPNHYCSNCNAYLGSYNK